MEFIISLKGWLHSSELSSDTGLSTVLLDIARQLEVKRLLLGWIEKKNYFFLNSYYKQWTKNYTSEITTV